MPFAFDVATIGSYLQIVLINVVLSGDNVIVIGMAAAGLPPELRNKAVFSGIGAATVIRLVFAVLATQLLAITGILVLGGLLLLYVCWNMFKELRDAEAERRAAEQHLAETGVEQVAATVPSKTLRQAVMQIILADVSMSLDNVLAVAGAAKQNLQPLIFGLLLSVVLMAAASTLIARLLGRFRWIAWIGLAIIVYVSIGMLYEGTDQLLGHTLPEIPLLKSGPAVEAQV